MLSHQLEIGADNPDRDRRQRAEAHDLGHHIARLETKGRQLRLLLGLFLLQAPLLEPLGQPGITRSGKTLRNRSRNSSSLIPLSSVSATRNWPSSGPRMNNTMLSMPKLGATWPT